MIAFLVGFAITCLFTWGAVIGIWGSIYPYILSMVPSASAYAPLVKLGITVLIAWFGGIAIPLGIFIWGTILSLAAASADSK